MPQLTLVTVLLLFSKSLWNVTLPNIETFLFQFITFKMLLFITKFQVVTFPFLDCKHRAGIVTQKEKNEYETAKNFHEENRT